MNGIFGHPARFRSQFKEFTVRTQCIVDMASSFLTRRANLYACDKVRNLPYFFSKKKFTLLQNAIYQFVS